VRKTAASSWSEVLIKYKLSRAWLRPLDKGGLSLAENCARVEATVGARIKEFLQQWLICTLSVLVAAEIVTGIHYDTWHSLLAATLLLGVLNTFVRPLLTFLSLPLVVLTLGLFRLVINAVLLLLVHRMIDRFHVDNFAAAFWGALVIGVVSLLLNSLTGTGEGRVEFRRGKGRPPRDKSDGGNGPVIDV